MAETISYESTLNQDGSFTNKEIIQYDCNKVKQGYRRMYNDLFEIYNECKSQRENRLVSLILQNTSTRFTMDHTYKQLSRKLGCNEKWVANTMVKLRKLGLLKGQNGNHIINPHVFIPYGIPSKIISDAQYEWTLSKSIKNTCNYNHLLSGRYFLTYKKKVTRWHFY